MIVPFAHETCLRRIPQLSFPDSKVKYSIKVNARNRELKIMCKKIQIKLTAKSKKSLC